MEKKSKLFTLRLDAEIFKQLEKIASRGDRPVKVAYVVRQAIVEFIKREK